MWDKLKGLGSGAIGIVGLIIFGILGALVLQGSVWLGETALPFFKEAASIGFYVVLLLLLPLSLFRKLRGFTGATIVLASYLFGITVWLWSVLVAYTLWGWLGLSVGLFMAGVGVLPIAILASMFNGMWELAFSLIIMLVIAYGARVLGYYIAGKASSASSSSRAPSQLYTTYAPAQSSRNPLDIIKGWFKSTHPHVRQCRDCLRQVAPEFDRVGFQEVRPHVERLLQNEESLVEAVKLDSMSASDRVYFLISNMAARILTSGEYNLYFGLLGPQGHDILAVFDQANSRLLASGFFTMDEVNESRASLKEAIAQVG